MSVSNIFGICLEWYRKHITVSFLKCCLLRVAANELIFIFCWCRIKSDSHPRRSTKERHRNPAPHICKVGYCHSQLVFSLLLPCRLQPSIAAEHWNHLGSFKSPGSSNCNPQRFQSNWSRVKPGHWGFEKLPKSLQCAAKAEKCHCGNLFTNPSTVLNKTVLYSHLGYQSIPELSVLFS